MEKRILISGIVGSTAYGLDHAGSDIDLYGVFCEDFEGLHSLTPTPQSYVTTKPDSTFHEAAKYVRLALKCNPSVMELLWLDHYQVLTDFGADLVELREAFLSRKYVRNAYFGYATDQFHKLFRRGDGTFGPDVARRTEKHARHIMRLLDHGFDLYTKGELHLRVSDPERYMEFGRKVAEDPRYARPFITRAEEAFNAATCVLPETPDIDRVQQWLYAVRRTSW